VAPASAAAAEVDGPTEHDAEASPPVEASILWFEKPRGGEADRVRVWLVDSATCSARWKGEGGGQGQV
jgi:hypothetical protein